MAPTCGGRAIDAIACEVALGVVGPIQVDDSIGSRRDETGGGQGRRDVAASATVIAEETVDPLRVIDEGVSIALEGKDLVVTQELLGVDRVFGVPLQENREHAHIGDRLIRASIRGRNQSLIVRQDQIGL